MNKKSTLIKMLILLVTVALSAVSYFLLPEAVAVQWSSTGVSNTLPKLAAVLIPIAVCLLILIEWSIKKNDLSRPMNVAWGVASCLGAAINIVILILNRYI